MLLNEIYLQKRYSVIIEMGSFLDKRSMQRLSGVQKLLGAVWAIPRQGIKLHGTNALDQFL